MDQPTDQPTAPRFTDPPCVGCSTCTMARSIAHFNATPHTVHSGWKCVGVLRYIPLPPPMIWITTDCNFLCGGGGAVQKQPLWMCKSCCPFGWPVCLGGFTDHDSKAMILCILCSSGTTLFGGRDQLDHAAHCEWGYQHHSDPEDVRVHFVRTQQYHTSQRSPFGQCMHHCLRAGGSAVGVDLRVQDNFAW